MDNYTNQTKQWLEERFKVTDENGIYFAHQPIYGFGQGHCESGIHDRYIITYEIMKALAHLNFSSFLDAGGAEGYKAFLVKNIFGGEVVSSDLSQEACARAKEIFGIRSIPADIHSLPFQDAEFDVTLCSESLEHVTNWEKGVEELLRVSKKAVVITLPHESEDAVMNVKKEQVPHGHIHHFDLNSMDFLKKKGYQVISAKIVRTKFRIPQFLIDKKAGIYNPKKNKCPKILIDLAYVAFYWPLQVLVKKPFGKILSALSIELDSLLIKAQPSYNSILFVLLKDKACYSKDKIRPVSIQQVMDITVPYFILENKKQDEKGE